MATTKTRKSDAKKQLSDYYLYVPLGAGQLIVEKTKTVSAKAFKLAKGGRKSAVRTYEDLAKRGEKLVTSVRRSTYTRRAIDQAKSAQSQVKAAATGVRKTAGATSKAAKSAAKKVG